MKSYFIVPLCVIFLAPLAAIGQLNNGGVNAYFGVDADTRSNFVKYGPLTGPIASDDWFSPSGSGNNVIDTSNAATYLALLQASNNISFNKRMSALLYAKLSGKLWLDAAYGRDFLASASSKDSTTFTVASKNGDDPANWRGGTSNFPGKNDLVDVFAHMRRDGINVHDSLWFFTGASTFGTTGSSYFDVELYKKSFTYSQASGLFTSAGTEAGHTQWRFDASGNIIQTGDLIVAVSFSPGSVPVIDLRIWVSKTTATSITPAYFNFTGTFDGASGAATYGYASIVSKTGTTAWGAGISNYSSVAAQDTTYSTPWGTANNTGSYDWTSQYQTQQFIEVGLNLTRIGVDPALYSALSPCQSLFSNIFFKSRSSNSFTSNMQDFVTPLVFLRDPVMDYSVKPDTLRCNHTSGTIQITNNTTAGYYTWQTANGTISGSNGDSSQLSITKAGKYIVSSSPAQGCPATRTDTVVIPIDTFPPVASVAVSLVGGLTATGYLQLYGGNTSASNYSTPFGGSQGLSWNWSGPHSFSSTIQNPRTADTAWGTYSLTVTEKRNGCTAVASQNVSPVMFAVLETNGIYIQGNYQDQSILLKWEDQNAADTRSYEIERGDVNGTFIALGSVSGVSSFSDTHPWDGRNLYRIKAVSMDGQSRYSGVLTVNASAQDAESYFLAANRAVPGAALVANVRKPATATVAIYTIAGQAIYKKNVVLNQGINVVDLPEAPSRSARIVVLFIGNRLAYSQKTLY